MAKFQRNFIQGIMNKSLDERLVPNGQYIDAQNVRLGSTEGGEIGSVENAKGNVQQSTLQFPAAIPDIAINLSDSAVCIGSYADSANETMYWFVHDPAWLGIFPNGAPTGTAGVSGTNTSANTNELIDNTASFTTDGTSVGDLVVATASGSSAYITSITDDTTLVLNRNLFPTTAAPPFPLAYAIFTDVPAHRCDLIVSLTTNAALTYHAVSLWDNVDCATQWRTTLNFDPRRLVNGINKIGDYLFFTDNYNPPRKIDTTESLPAPIIDQAPTVPTVSGDQFTEEEILVIRRPPATAPTLTFPDSSLVSSSEKNYLESRLICFATRYQYADGQYSAISQFTDAAFEPLPFSLSDDSLLNGGMQNKYNSVTVSYDTGGELVTGIEILFKDADDSIVKIIERVDKQNGNGTGPIPNNTTLSVQFNNSKIYAVLNPQEILRLYDNVPLRAQAQTIMGNRLMYGNYIEGYNLINRNSNRVIQEYTATLNSDIPSQIPVPTTTSTHNYETWSFCTATGLGPVAAPNAKLRMNFTGLDNQLRAGNILKIKFGYYNDGGGQTWNVGTLQNWFGFTNAPNTNAFIMGNVTWEWRLPIDYDSPAAMFGDTNFLNAIGQGTVTNGNIKIAGTGPNGACTGQTLTDTLNCLTYDTVNVDIGGVSTNLVRFTSGASIDQPTILNLLTNQAGQAINANGVGGVFDPNNFDLVLNPIIYNNPNGTPAAAPFSQSAVAFAAWNNAEVSISSTNANKSLHSNRGYEVGIVYMDEYNRSTTALTSSTNTVSTTCSMSDKVNYIRVEIPPTQLAPNWAQTYKFVIKPDEETYDTIYSTRAFVNPKDSCIYFLVDGENASKVSVGQRLIVKKDASGAVETCEYVSVLDKKAQPENFIHPLNPFSTGAPYSDMAYLDSQQQIEANEIYTAQGQGDNPKYKYVPEGVYIKMKNVPFLINGISSTTTVAPPVYPQPPADTTLAAIPITQTSFSEGPSPVLEYHGISGAVDSLTGLYEEGDFVLGTGMPIPLGTIVTLTFKFQRKGTSNAATGERMYTYERTFTSNANYNNIKDFWDGLSIGETLNFGTNTGNLCSSGMDNIYIPDTFASGSPAGAFAGYPDELCVNYFRFWQNETNSELCLLIKGGTGGNSPSSGSRIIATIDIAFVGDITVFETEPQEALPEIWYEGSQTYTINQTTGAHNSGTESLDQNQIPFDQPSPQSAFVKLNFHDCFMFGNGVESYKIRDSLLGKSFSLGNRVTSTTENFKQENRFASITYSELFNDESNSNGLNVFNLGLLNFKPLNEEFGPIRVLSDKKTDVLILQEDKISYVLVEKNLLSDSEGGGSVASIPEILGTQIARTEDYGISDNPESYVEYGKNKFFVDYKRGAVLKLSEDGDARGTLEVISDYGMRGYFRDSFNGDYGANTQKLGGFDPYMNEYVVSLNSFSTLILTQDPCDILGIPPSDIPSDDCIAPDGTALTYTTTTADVITQGIVMTEDIGTCSWTANATGISYNISIEFNGAGVALGGVPLGTVFVGAGTSVALTWDKLTNTDANGGTTAIVTITPASSSDGVFNLQPLCSIPIMVQTIPVVIGSLAPDPIGSTTTINNGATQAQMNWHWEDVPNNTAGEVLSNSFEWGEVGMYALFGVNYPLVAGSNSGDTNWNLDFTGAQGTTAPSNGSVVYYEFSNTTGPFPDFTNNLFDVTKHKLLYIRSLTTYEPTLIADRKQLLADCYDATIANSGVMTLESFDETTQNWVNPAVNGADKYRGYFTVPNPVAPNQDPYIYLVADFRNFTPDFLCHSTVAGDPGLNEVCCQCECANTYACYKITNTSTGQQQYTFQYTDTGGLLAEETIFPASPDGPYIAYVCSSTFPAINLTNFTINPDGVPSVTVDCCGDAVGCSPTCSNCTP